MRCKPLYNPWKFKCKPENGCGELDYGCLSVLCYLLASSASKHLVTAHLLLLINLDSSKTISGAECLASIMSYCLFISLSTLSCTTHVKNTFMHLHNTGKLSCIFWTPRYEGECAKKSLKWEAMLFWHTVKTLTWRVRLYCDCSLFIFEYISYPIICVGTCYIGHREQKVTLA